MLKYSREDRSMVERDICELEERGGSLEILKGEGRKKGRRSTRWGTRI